MATLQSLWPYVAALVPTIGLAFLFFVILKHIVEGDRRERAALREWERTTPDEASKESDLNGRSDLE